MENADICWKQRLANYSRTLSLFEKFVKKGNDLNELEKQGLIQAFEYTFELAWNVLKDYYEYQAVTEIQGSRDAFTIAFNRGLIMNGEDWMKMIVSRTKTSHTYNEETADEIAATILNTYYKRLFKIYSKIILWRTKIS